MQKNGGSLVNDLKSGGSVLTRWYSKIIPFKKQGEQDANDSKTSQCIEALFPVRLRDGVKDVTHNS